MSYKNIDNNQKIKYIGTYLKNNYKTTTDQPGLLTGYLGILLFFIEYSKKHSDFSIPIPELTAKLLDDIQEGKVRSLDLANGFSGYLFTLYVLEQHGYLEKGITLQLFEKVKPIFIKELEKKIYRKEYDFLYGYIGMLYVAEKVQKGFVYENAFIESILNSSEKGSIWRYWNKPLKFNGKEHEVDYGLAHGMPCIISFLLTMYENKADPVLGEELQVATEYLMSLAKFNGKSFFTYSSIEKIPTRLAWCYGDLPNSILLNRLGKTLGNEAAIRLSEKILIDIETNRCSKEASGVEDNSICHGTMGISFQFSYLSKLLNNSKYQDLSYQWSKMADQDDFELQNIYFPKPSQVGNKLNMAENLSFLSGMSGCGLAYLSMATSESLIWEDLLMLN